MSLISCENLSLSYDNHPVIQGLTFSVEVGDCLCIVGENGTGKSTLIKALLGLKTPSDGRITYGAGLKSTDIGYLPQRTEAQKDFPASVWEVVLSGRMNRHRFFSFFDRYDKSIAEGELEKLGIASIKNRSFSELSGGQQQRVLLARALCAAKELILLDEPVAGLDPLAAAELYATVGQLICDGMTVIMVSHDLASALKCATKVLWLKNHDAVLYTAEEFEARIPSLLLGGDSV